MVQRQGLHCETGLLRQRHRIVAGSHAIAAAVAAAGFGGGAPQQRGDTRRREDRSRRHGHVCSHCCNSIQDNASAFGLRAVIKQKGGGVWEKEASRIQRVAGQDKDEKSFRINGWMDVDE